MPLDSQRLRLREMRKSDYELMVSLRNDLITQAWSRTLPPDFTYEMIAKRYDEKEFSVRRTDATFIIEELETGRAVGYCGYSGLVDRHSAVIGIAFLQDVHGKGYAGEVNELLLQLLFDEMGLQAVGLWTHSGNPGAVASAERAGFRVAVQFREAIFKGGHHYDNLYMDMTREEYYESRPSEDRLGKPAPHTQMI